jgi:Family of unknown function (DUF6090)
MIKFFRHIRKSMIRENRTSKYLLYAIGEIVLVVIGILIALQINTKNETRKLENSTQNLMLALKQECLVNKKMLEAHVLALHKHNAKLNKLINYSAGAVELPIDSVRDYASNLQYPITLSLLNSVLNEAVSAGKIEMLSDSLKQKLSFLKEYAKSRETVSKMLDDLSSNNGNEFTDLLLNLSAIPEIPDQLYVQPPIAMHQDFIKNNEELDVLIKSATTYAQLRIIYNASTVDEVWITYGLLRLTTETIDLIDDELKDE